MSNYTIEEIRQFTLKMMSASGGTVPSSSYMRSKNRKLYNTILNEFENYRTFRNWMKDPNNYHSAWSYTGDDSLLEYVEQRIKPEFGQTMPTQVELQRHGHATFAAKTSLYKNKGMRGLIADSGMTTHHNLPVLRTRANMIKEAHAISSGSPKTLPSYDVLRKHHKALLAAIQKQYSSLVEFAADAELNYHPQQTNWNDSKIIDALKALSGARDEWPGKWKVESIKGLYRAILRRGGPKSWCEKLSWTYGHLAADGEYYDSNAEVLVANLLLQHGIPYEHSISNDQTDPYIPDFFLTEEGFFVEVLMCDCNEKQTATVRKNYCKRWKAKLAHYKKNKVPFVTISPDELESTLGVKRILAKLNCPDSISGQVQGPLRQKSRKGHGYWKNWSVIEKAITGLTHSTGYLPQRRYFFSSPLKETDSGQTLSSLYHAIHNHHGGLEGVAERMDIPPAPDLPHKSEYWKQRDNVLMEYAIAYSIEGKVPTVYELQRANQLSLVNAILAHGGIDQIRQQFNQYIEPA